MLSGLRLVSPRLHKIAGYSVSRRHPFCWSSLLFKNRRTHRWFYGWCPLRWMVVFCNTNTGGEKISRGSTIWARFRLRGMVALCILKEYSILRVQRLQLPEMKHIHIACRAAKGLCGWNVIVPQLSSLTVRGITDTELSYGTPAEKEGLIRRKFTMYMLRMRIFSFSATTLWQCCII